MTRRGFRLSLFHCGKCGARYNSLLGHVCKSNRRRGKVRLAPQASRACSSCGKPYANPLTHVCSNRGDFAKRKRAAKRKAAADKRKAETAVRQAKVRARVADVRKKEKAKADSRVKAARTRRKAPAKPRAPRDRHEYQACRDEDCTRLACGAFREGHAQGFADGMQAAEAGG